jgi:hypothetical protein
MKSRQITALFTLVALLIAPLCAPLCHSHVCGASSSTAQNDACHKSSAGDAPRISLAAVHNCGLQELPTAVLSEAANLPDVIKQQNGPVIALNFTPSPSVLLGASGTESPHSYSESHIQSSSVLPAVLRI